MSRQNNSQTSQDAYKQAANLRSAEAEPSHGSLGNASQRLPTLSDLMKDSLGLRRDGSSSNNREFESINFDQSDLASFYQSRSRPSTGTPGSESMVAAGPSHLGNSRAVSSPATTSSSFRSGAATPCSRSSAPVPLHHAADRGAKKPAKKSSSGNSGSASRPVVSWR